MFFIVSHCILLLTMKNWNLTRIVISASLLIISISTNHTASATAEKLELSTPRCLPPIATADLIRKIKAKLIQYAILKQDEDYLLGFEIGEQMLEQNGFLNESQPIDELPQHINQLLLTNTQISLQKASSAQEWRLRELFPSLLFDIIPNHPHNLTETHYKINSYRPEYLSSIKKKTKNDETATSTPIDFPGNTLQLPNHTRNRQQTLTINSNSIQFLIKTYFKTGKHPSEKQIFHLSTSSNLIAHEMLAFNADRWIKKLPNTNVAYVQFPNLPVYNNRAIQNILKIAFQNNNLILDLRGTKLGSILEIGSVFSNILPEGTVLGSYFNAKMLQEYCKEMQKENPFLSNSELLTFKTYLETLDKTILKVAGADPNLTFRISEPPNMCIITDCYTSALAEMIVAVLKKNYPPEKLVHLGEPTAGNTDYSIEYHLNSVCGAYYIQCPTLNVILPDGTLLLGGSLEPDILCYSAVWPSVDNDPIIIRCVEELSKIERNVPQIISSSEAVDEGWLSSWWG